MSSFDKFVLVGASSSDLDRAVDHEGCQGAVFICAIQGGLFPFITRTDQGTRLQCLGSVNVEEQSIGVWRRDITNHISNSKREPAA